MECCTDFKTDEIEVKWVIKNITSIFNRIGIGALARDALKSNEFFTMINHKNQWRLALDVYHRGEEWVYDIDLRLLTTIPVTFVVKYYFLNAQNQKILVSEPETVELMENYRRHSINFTTKLSGKEYRINDTLTIFCYLKELGNLFTYNKLPQILNVYPDENLSNDLKNSLTSEQYTDVTLVINETEFKAHKLILSSRSPVFAAMFSHPNMQENQTNQVNIKDTNSATMKTFLEFLYTGKIENINEDKLDLYILSDRYGVDSLKQICEEFICNSLSIESVIEVLKLADLSNNENMMNAALMFLDDHKDQVFDSADDFEKFIKIHPHLIYKLFKKSFIKVKIESKPLE